MQHCFDMNANEEDFTYILDSLLNNNEPNNKENIDLTCENTNMTVYSNDTNKTSFETESYNCNNQNLLENAVVLTSDDLNTTTNRKSQGERIINVENQHMKLSSILHDGCEFRNVEKCVKRLRFSTTEKVAEENAFFPVQQYDDPQINDVQLSQGNDTDEDSEYVPSEQSSNDESIHDEPIHDEMQNKTTTSVSSLDTSNTVTIGCNDEVMYVETSNVKSTKKYYCLFCKKMKSQLARHLETIHRTEPEVKKFAMLPKKHPERIKIIETIRKKGNFEFNTNLELNP